MLRAGPRRRFGFPLPQCHRKLAPFRSAAANHLPQRKSAPARATRTAADAGSFDNTPRPGAVECVSLESSAPAGARSRVVVCGWPGGGPDGRRDQRGPPRRARGAGRSVSFVLSRALARAEETPIERRRFELDAERWAAFMAALDVPRASSRGCGVSSASRRRSTTPVLDDRGLPKSRNFGAIIR